MKRRSRLSLAVLVPVCLLGFLLWNNAAWLKSELGSEAGPLSEESEQRAVVSLVEDFGKKLQLVSLLAPADAVNKSMEENYGGLVSPQTIAEWAKDPENAPGRLVSSPWPDRIEILNITKASAQVFKVEGEIVEVTSTEKENKGAAARRPITLEVEKAGERWLITSVTFGDYKDLEAILYRNTQYGFTFSLPSSWQGYSIVTSTWSGTAVDGPKAGQVVETGPLILIRHPEWTAEKPRQDIPIMIFTLSQWTRLQDMEFSVSAAPIGPKMLGRNSKYAFALPARYNYAFPTGFEEVERILEKNPLEPNEAIR